MPKDNLIIVNNRPAAVMLPAFAQSENPNPVTQIAERQGLTLLPGENDVSAAYWKHCSTNPAVKIWLACEYLENKGGGKAKSFAEGIDSLTVAEAVKRIGASDSVKLISNWKNETKKKTVAKACEDRIAELVAAADGEIK